MYYIYRMYLNFMENSIIKAEDTKLPQLTVVILTYNSSHTMAACLDSLVKQENQDFCVNIVDDDSTDDTLLITNAYSSKLTISILKNGSHKISKGRNIGISAARTGFVAFLDSDDYADSHWTEAIISTFTNKPQTALLSGPIIFTAQSASGKAIATNDGVIRRLFSRRVEQFSTANSAFNKNILATEILFDEDFTYAEDLEIASRIQDQYEWIFVPEMKINQTSRGTMAGYALQMYRYGRWKIYYGFVANAFRPLDFIPLLIGLGSIVASLFFFSWIPLLTLVIFSLCESLFVIAVTRKEPLVSMLTFPAWIIKNCAWSLGVALGLITLLSDSRLRKRFQNKRSKKLRVVQVSAFYPPHLGGLERVVLEVSEQLAHEGNEVIVVTSNIDAGRAPANENFVNLTIKRLRSFQFAHVAWIPGLLYQLIRTRKPAVFHLHLAQAYVPEMVWLASKLRGIPYIVHFHLDVDPSGPFGFIFVWWKRWIQPVIIKGAAHVITLSPDQTKLIMNRYGINADKVTFIGNGVSEKFLEIGKSVREFHSPLRLLSVGRFSIQKRPERLIEALSLIKSPVTLTLVGDGEDRAKLEGLVAKLGLKNITFKGVLQGDDLLEAYRQADVFTISSDREGMSLAILEAMGAGLPIVGSDVLGIHEAVEGVGILVPNPSPETFAQAINDLAAHQDRLPQLSAASYRKAQEFSWLKLVNRLEEVYRSITI
jgi:glycosyltransferase involved in cell wall biosynthesis